MLPFETLHDPNILEPQGGYLRPSPLDERPAAAGSAMGLGQLWPKRPFDVTWLTSTISRSTVYKVTSKKIEKESSTKIHGRSIFSLFGVAILSYDTSVGFHVKSRGCFDF